MDSILRSQIFHLPLLVLLFFCLPSISESNQFGDTVFGYGESTCGVSSPSASKILIKGGTVVNAHQQEVADVYVEDGIIVAVKPHVQVGDDVTVLDATGKFVMPGGIDPHTHLAMEFMGTETIDDFFTGQAAALAGGTTMHIDFVIPVNGSLTAGFEAYEKKSRKSCMDYGFHMAITKWDETISKEMEIMVKEKGINSFKFFLAYKGSLMISDELLLEGFKKCKALGALAMVHAENGDAVYEGQQRMIELGITGPEGHALSRPPVLEGEATARAIRLAGFINNPLYVVHVMSIDAMEEIAKARKSGTDHCTFNSTQKALGIDDFRKIPNGVNGIEERMHLVWDTMVESGQISVTDYVRVTSAEWPPVRKVYTRRTKRGLVGDSGPNGMEDKGLGVQTGPSGNMGLAETGEADVGSWLENLSGIRKQGRVRSGLFLA
ncbi:hypothetical protein L484_004383 [Morus notabilis]|uniref:dihydropyrimidinase n=1 Tax=Morus notabilis TaxID=981085 RepID=W9RZW0_9ROSA|nr:hypothetical protein L484_004383 [Morus notabilis]